MRPSPWHRVLAAACLLVLLGAALRVAVHDPTSEPVSGDQASFVYQALSLRGGDLAYDETDQARWLELGWADQPHGLFVQKRDDGWAFAKPLGYSVLLAPAMALVDAQGIALVNAALVLAYAGCWYGLGRLRWDRPTAVTVATAATVASHAWLFGFPVHADLFVAVLVGLAALGAARAAWPWQGGARSPLDVLPASASQEPLDDRSTGVSTRTTRDIPASSNRRHRSQRHSGQRGSGPAAGTLGAPPHSGIWLLLSAAATALLVTEKLPALVALAPLLVLAVLRAPWKARLAAAAVGMVVLAVSVAPYVFYSDGASWSAYGGDRYYALNSTPWSGGTEADLTSWHTRDSLTPSFVLDQVADPSEDLPSAALTYAIGRHTGLLTFEPLSATLLTAGAFAAVMRFRRRGEGSRSGRGAATAENLLQPAADRAPEPAGAAAGSGDGGATRRAIRLGWLGGAAAAGLASYVALYLLVFTDNYFGGGQSIGNRYFLQVSPLVALVAVGAPVGARVARWCAAAAAAWALVFLHPLLRSPEEAFFHIERTSAAQELLPFDGSQKHSWRFGCEPAECVPPPLEAFDG